MSAPDSRAPEGVRPVFLIGAARSGTSLLYKVMAQHPASGWLSNWVQRYPSLPQLSALNHVARALPARRDRTWFGAEGDNAYVYGRRRRTLERMFPMPAEAETFYARYGIPEPGPGPEATQDVEVEALRRAFRSVATWDRRPVVLSKRIANNRRLGLLARAFPQARFVEIVRDGRAVAASLAKVDWWETDPVWWYGGLPSDWRAAGGDPWELCARNWVEEVRAVRDGLVAVPGERVLSLRYEDLVEAPGEAVAGVLQFSGLDPADARWRAAFASVRFPDNNQRWRNSFSSADLDLVERVQRPELLHYGYLSG